MTGMPQPVLGPQPLRAEMQPKRHRIPGRQVVTLPVNGVKRPTPGLRVTEEESRRLHVQAEHDPMMTGELVPMLGPLAEVLRLVEERHLVRPKRVRVVRRQTIGVYPAMLQQLPVPPPMTIGVQVHGVQVPILQHPNPLRLPELAVPTIGGRKQTLGHPPKEGQLLPLVKETTGEALVVAAVHGPLVPMQHHEVEAALEENVELALK